VEQRWTAVLAPVGVTGKTPQIISPDCKISVRGGAPLVTHEEVLLGEVTHASITDGYVVVVGVLMDGQDIPTGCPTFDFNPWSRYAIDTSNSCVDTEFRFIAGEITSVRSGFEPCWDDPKIAFSLADPASDAEQVVKNV